MPGSSGWALALALLLPAPSLATDVRVVAITPGRSADVVVNGRSITLEIGEATSEGVKLLRVDRDRAVVRVDGATRTLPLVAERPAVETSSGGGGGAVTFSTDARGQFSMDGLVNGAPVRFVVDTGASVTTLSTGVADRIGLRYDTGLATKAMTVNGLVDAWRVSLRSVQVGGVTARDVEAIVVDNDTLPVVLLGMTFLGQFDMRRQGATLVLRRR